MPDRDSLSDRGRSLEDEYFWRKDRELIEKLREAGAREQQRKELGRKAGLADPALLQQLHDLGFDPDTVVLLPLLPVVQVAWAEGGVTAAERELIVRLARSRGIAEGSPADRRLGEWMSVRPADTVFEHAARLIRAVLASGSAEVPALDVNDLVKYCEEIAGASGGIFGIGRISAEERQVLAKIEEDLKARHS